MPLVVGKDGRVVAKLGCLSALALFGAGALLVFMVLAGVAMATMFVVEMWELIF